MNDILTHDVVVAPGFLPDVDDEPKPGPELCKSLADALVAGLERRGWRIEYRWDTYEGVAFDARRQERRYDVEVSSLDRGPREDWRGRWLVVAKPRSGFFRRLWAARYDADEHALLRLNLDEVLAGDARVESHGPWSNEREAATA